MRYWIPTILLLITLSVGCSSIKTTAFDRLEDDTLVANPEKPLKGVPVSLRVPTHLELTVEEKTFWRVEGAELIPISSCRGTRTVDHSVKYIEKIFLVDPVRPAAGPVADPPGDPASNSYGFSFKNDELTAEEIENGVVDKYAGKGQLEGIHYHINDSTIERSAQLLASSLSFIKTFAPKGEKTGFGEKNAEVTGLDVIQTTRVIAWSRFDLNSEHFEEDVMGFLNTYINQKSYDPGSPE